MATRDELLLSVTAPTESQVKAESGDLLDWLSGEPELRGRVRPTDAVAEEGTMGGDGGFGQIVVEGLVQGTLGPTLAAFLGYVGHSVGSWWNQRRGSSSTAAPVPTVSATLGNGVTVVISGLTPAEAATALALAGAADPEPAAGGAAEDDGGGSAPATQEGGETGPRT
ncbi:hypothetical protein ACIRSF_33325 [Streptomyces rubiginosohelvolus]|uniref:effector-associated constant component EACC1 n=1 Tax=Streptomyces rubiginosohelvolus TaxID=67362 RepID=UPI003823AC1C